MVGSPAYVPREIGPLAMPVDVNGLTDARGHFLKFGTEPDSKSAEGLVVKTNEMDLAPAGDDSHTGLPASQVVNAAKVDLWDSDWEGGRYYWTVVPVDEIPAQQLSTTLNSGSLTGDTTIDVVDATGINAGDSLRIGYSAGDGDRRRSRGHHDHAHRPRSAPPIRPVTRSCGRQVQSPTWKTS